MTARQRSGAVALASPPAAALSNRPVGPLAWEDWFSLASTQQQKEALDLAREQGVLYLHQIPALKAAAKPNGFLPDANRLAHLLSADLSLLAPVFPGERPLECPDLDLAQREAVARALNTPDLFLLEGTPGSGKTRVVAEIVREACRRGLRVLFLARHACSLDAVLVQVANDAEVFGLRYLAPEEAATLLPASVQGLIPSHRVQVFSERLKRTAKQVKEDLEEDCGAWQRQAAVWETVNPLAARLLASQRELQESQAREAELEGRIRSEDPKGETPFQRSLAEIEARRDERRVEFARRRVEAKARLARDRAALAELQPRLDELRPLAEARRGGRWWSWTWWKALLRGNVLEQFQEVERQAARHRSEAADAQGGIDAIAAEERQVEQARDAEREAIVHQEIEGRRANLVEERREIFERHRALEQTLREALEALPDEDRPGVLDAKAVEESFARWQSRFEEARRKQEWKRCWARYLEESASDFLARLPVLANLVASCVDAFPPEQAGTHFDLLIVEDAQGVTEAELLRVGRQAMRWVLVGEHERESSVGSAGDGSRPEGAAPRPHCFSRLWRHLHQDAGSPPYLWLREGERLCCQLRPLTAQETASLEVECLADFPEVELRIASTPAPALAQILFPAKMDVAQAKQFIYRELQEAPCRRLGPTAWLTEDGAQVVCHLTSQCMGCMPVELEKGLREWANERCTSRLVFEKASGWTRSDAEQWVRQKVGLRDVGRTLVLSVCHRAKAELGALLSDIFFPERMLPVEGALDATRAGLVFVPVPAAARENGRKSRGSSGLSAGHWPREGAGLEIDLTAVRTADRMPNDLRALLPRKGYANYSEAQAVVRHLEGLLGEGSRTVGDVAVIALYEGQVELVRILIERSEILKGLGRIEVGLPEAFRQREFAAVLVSLTRSHSHRAVAIGESPADLPLAFTRACERVVFFGDPGNLIKRAAWQGPLEHLDAAAAAAESRHIAALARYLQGQAEHQAFFRVEVG